MDTMMLVVGILYMLLATLLAPPYIRIVYILLSRKKYRDLECYRIMAQTGLVQLSAAPGTFFCGLMQLTDVVPFEIVSFLQIIFCASVSVEILLNLVLSLNRLMVILDIEWLAKVSKILLVLSWTYGVVYVAALLTPYCRFSQKPGQFIGEFDFSFPYTWLLVTVDENLLISCTSVTFIVYLILISYLIRVKRRNTTLNSIAKERSILVYAVVRFLFDMTLQVVFYFVELPPTQWSQLAVGFTYILSSLFVSPALYLTLTTSLRTDFWDLPFIKGTTIVHAVPTLSRSSRNES
ncbi:hypothetical protein QR680_010040 [Steinernema hermaphroditum]|uniref:7TM GPCR serpentine receptor class x (Srx) domain-containing protein n=1 Tax=Steinernema hermaphroditum TaxID=289476 RepID=A0AA39IP59_9BILA|nr:hypothetical protein QR680_010040 [Steinernema hermaphroditum]